LPLLSVPVIVIEYTPASADTGAITLSVSVSLLGMVIPVEEIVFDEAKLAQAAGFDIILLLGSVIDDTFKVTGPVNPPSGETSMKDDDAVPPAATSTSSCSASIVKLPVCTVACTEHDVSLPFGSVPTMVTMAVPATVVGGTVRVSVVLGLAAETVVDCKVAATVAPVTGSAETVATSVTPAVKPASGDSVIVVGVPVVTPMGTVTVVGLQFSQKLASTLTSKVVDAVGTTEAPIVILYVPLTGSTAEFKASVPVTISHVSASVRDQAFHPVGASFVLNKLHA
jgi:hypothetical protein